MNKKQPPLDFFGNEIEVGDEVAFQVYDTLVKGTISQINEPIGVYATDIYGAFRFLGDSPRLEIVVNTEKKHREKALDYLVAEAQEMGMYEEGVGITTLKDGYE